MFWNLQLKNRFFENYWKVYSIVLYSFALEIDRKHKELILVNEIVNKMKFK